MVVGGIFLASALAFTIYNFWDNARAGRAAAEILTRLDETIDEAKSELESETSSDDVPLYVIEPDIEMPTVEIDGNRYIGEIDLPALGVTLPVMSEWTTPSLKLTPCRYKGTAYKSGFIIMGHNYDNHFGRIKLMEQGSLVTFTDVEGNVFNYTVELVEILLPTDVEEMEAGDWDLTLFTCSYSTQYRETVRCTRVK